MESGLTCETEILTVMPREEQPVTHLNLELLYFCPASLVTLAPGNPTPMSPGGPGAPPDPLSPCKHQDTVRERRHMSV